MGFIFTDGQNNNLPYLDGVDIPVRFSWEKPYPTWIFNILPYYNDRLPFLVPLSEVPKFNTPVSNERIINVFDIDNQLVACLDERNIRSCKISKRENEEFEMKFEILKSCDNYTNILNISLEFESDNMRFTRIQSNIGLEEKKDENGAVWVTFSCVGAEHKLKKKYITAYNSTTGYDKIDDLMVVILSGGIEHLHVNGLDIESLVTYEKGSAGYVIYALLYGTGWSVGTVDVSGKYDLETDKTSILENLYKVQELWGGFLIFDYKLKKISLRDESIFQPYNGVRFTSEKNIKTSGRQETTDLITRLYVFGKENLNLANVNGGKLYLEDFTYTSEILEGIATNEDIITQSELLNWGREQISLLCKPSETISGEIIDISTFPELGHEAFDLYDFVDYVDVTADIISKVRIVYKEYDYFNPYNCKVELGTPSKRLSDFLQSNFTNIENQIYTETEKFKRQNEISALIASGKNTWNDFAKYTADEIKNYTLDAFR